MAETSLGTPPRLSLLDLVGRWESAFRSRHESADMRMKFVLYSMVLAQIASIVLLLLNQLLAYKVIPVVGGVLAAALAQYIFLWAVQRGRLGIGSSGRRVGRTVAIPMLIWAGFFVAVSLLTNSNLLWLIFWEIVTLAFCYLVMVNFPIWFFEINQGDVLLTHSPERTDRDVKIHSRKPPQIPNNIAWVLSEVGLWETVSPYIDYDMPSILEEDVKTSWDTVFKERKEELKKVSQALGMSVKTSGTTAIPEFAPLDVLAAFIAHMKRLQTDPVFWLRPRDPYYVIWNQNEFISIDADIQNIVTQERLQISLHISFFAFVSPEQIKMPSNLVQLAQTPSPETIKAWVDYALRERVNQVAMRSFNNRSYLDAFSVDGLEYFRGLLAPAYGSGAAKDTQSTQPELYDLGVMWGISIYEPSIFLYPIMPEKIREVLEARAIADIQASTDLATMRQYLEEIEKMEVDPEIKKYLKLQIVALNAIDETRAKNSKRGGRYSYRAPGIIIPEPGLLDGNKTKTLPLQADANSPQASSKQNVKKPAKDKPKKTPKGPTSLGAARGKDGVFRVSKEDDPDI